MYINLETEFQDADHKQLTLNEIIKQIQNEVYNHPENQYKISVGTDSMTNRDTVFVLAIVLYRIGNGGIYFYKKFHFYSLTYNSNSFNIII